MARPKSNIKRNPICTTIKEELLVRLKEISESEGIAINRLIEVSLEKYLDKTGIDIK
jgi:hypothetical protein